MQLEIDPESEVPLSQQLRDRVVEGIATGAIQPGEPLASVRQLAVDFGINVATVSRGYELLRSEGLVRTNRRSGSVVARGPESGAPAEAFLPGWQARLRTLLAEGVAQGVSDDDVTRTARELLAEFADARSASEPHSPRRASTTRHPAPEPDAAAEPASTRTANPTTTTEADPA